VFRSRKSVSFPVGTQTTVYDCVTHATRGVYAGGGAAVKAATSLRAEILETAAKYLNVYADALDIQLDEEAGASHHLFSRNR